MEPSHSPIIACLWSSLAMMLFRDDFSGYIFRKQWGGAAGFIVVTWFGFFIFWAIVYGVFNVVNKKIPEKLRKYRKTAEAIVAVLVFCVAYYIGHYII